MQTAYQQVESLLDQMRDAVAGGNVKYDNLSDQLQVLTRSYLTPTIEMTGDEFGMTGCEASGFQILLKHAGNCVSREAFQDAVSFRRYDKAASHKLVDVHLCRIRKKLAGSKYRIETIWGKGFRLEKIAA